MACKNRCSLCPKLIISTAVTFTAGTGLVITIPEGSYGDGCKYCIIVGQNIPAATTITAPVFIQVGTGPVLYQLTQPCCEQVTACGIKKRTKYCTRVHTSGDTGTFRLLEKVCCGSDRLRALNGEGTAVTSAPTD